MTRRRSDNSSINAIRCGVASALVMVLAASAISAERPEGLMWNRSGLAATLPLQVKTSSGSDFLLELREIDSKKPILAAYIRGGEFFRVLVPTGHYELIFAAGTEWHGETAQFGPDTRRFILDPPLTFRATVSRKNGHLIDLRDAEAITIRDIAICQRIVLEPKRSLHGLYRRAEEPVLRNEPHQNTPLMHHQYYPWRYEVQSRFCD